MTRRVRLLSAMARSEPDQRLASVYLRLADVEERHLDFWEDQIRALGRDPGPRRPSWRARAMRLLARRFGAALVLPTVATLEQVDQEASRPTGGQGHRHAGGRAIARARAPLHRRRLAPGHRRGDPGPPRGASPGPGGQRAAGRGAGSQRRADLEPGPRDGHRRLRRGGPGGPHRGLHRAHGGGVLHGHRRMGVRPERPGAVPAPGEDRGGGDPPCSRRGEGGARPSSTSSRGSAPRRPPRWRSGSWPTTRWHWTLSSARSWA